MRSTPLLVALALSPLISPTALAEPSAEAADAPSVTELQAALKDAQAQGASHAKEAKMLAELLEGAAVMLDRRQKPEARVAAINTVAAPKDERVLPLLWATSGASTSTVRMTVVDVVSDWDHPEARTILGARAAARGESLPIRTKAINALEASGKTQSAELLYTIASDGAQTKEAKELALQALDRSFSEFMKSKARPQRKSEPGGLMIAGAGNALAGGVLLNSVGIWGQGDAAPSIGALGGAAIGAGTAALYAKDNPITVGQGMAYTSNVTWGLAGSLMASHYLFADESYDDHESTMALLRSVGVGIGAYTGYRYAQRNPSRDNVIKINAAGLIGSQIGRSTAHLGQSLLVEDKDCGGSNDNEACWREHDDHADSLSRTRTLAAMAGAAGGLTLGSMVKSDWKPESDDALFAAVVGVESIVASTLLTEAFGASEHAGAAADFGFFSASTGALIASHHIPVPREQSILIAYGAAAGNLLGAGSTLLPKEPPRDQTRAMVVAPAGIAGAVAGGWAHHHLDLTKGDWTMVGVGTAIGLAQIGAFSFVAADYGLIATGDQAGGTILTGTVLTSAGFVAASRNLSPEPIDSLFMGSAAAWGTLYGSVGQVALDLDLPRSMPVLATALSMDAGLAAGGLILSDKTDFGPRDTLVPQLCGVAGATLGSLGVLLATEEEQPVAIGALTGATVGLAAGSVLAPKLDLGKASAAIQDVLPAPQVDLPGTWSFVALPAVQQDGQLGTSMQLSVSGL